MKTHKCELEWGVGSRKIECMNCDCDIVYFQEEIMRIIEIYNNNPSVKNLIEKLEKENGDF